MRASKGVNIALDQSSSSFELSMSAIGPEPQRRRYETTASAAIFNFPHHRRQCPDHPAAIRVTESPR